MTPKPHFRIVANRPVEQARRESPLEAAQRRHGKPFGATWAIGEGPRFWTSDRVARLAALNEEDRMRRKNQSTKGSQ